MVERVTHQALIATLGADGDARVTKHGLQVALGQDGPVRVASHGIEIMLGQDGAVRVTNHGLLLMVSADRTISPSFLGSESEVYDYSALLEIDALGVPEPNPYRPDVPQDLHDLDPVFYDFYREVQETLRNQHNLIQAGDTTFHWSLMTKITLDKLYTLGSLGRFYHEDYGIIIGRYVQFKSISSGPWLGQPVGRLLQTQKAEWVVTNNLLISREDWVQGFTASLETITEGSYGWIIVSGANLYGIKLDQPTITAKNDSIVWSGFQKSKTGIAGYTWARVLVPGNVASLAPGSAFIHLEGYNDLHYIESVTDAFDDDFSDIQTHLGQIDDRLDALEATTLSLGNTLFRLDRLEANLNREVGDRRRADDELRVLIAANVSQAQLNVAVTNLTNAFMSADNGLQIQINAIRATANSAYDLVTILQGQVDLLTATVQSLLAADDGIWMPLVTGTVPPVLVYLDDGSLVRIEVEE